MKKKRKLGRKLLSFLLALAMVVGLTPGIALAATYDTTVDADSLQVNDLLGICNINKCDGYTFTLAEGGWVTESNLMFAGESLNGRANAATASLTTKGNYYNADKDNYTFPILRIAEYGICIEGDYALPFYNGTVADYWKVTSVDHSAKTVTLSGYTPPMSTATYPSAIQYGSFSAPLTCSLETKAANTCIVVDGTVRTWSEDQWYVVTGDVTIKKRITVSGTANLILMDGATLTAEKGITLSSGNTLNIYAQKQGTGALIATGSGSDAGIGGVDTSDSVKTCGTLNIHGGQITATAGGAWCAGIGGGFGKDGGTVTIYRGTVTATGGNYSGAGIGAGGDSGNRNGKGGTVYIYGGTVTTTGKEGGMGIGAGNGNPDNGTLILGEDVALYGSNDSMPAGEGTTDKVDTTVGENVSTRNTYMKAVGPQITPIANLIPVTITAANKEVTYSADGITIPVDGMFIITDGAGAATYSVENGTGEGTYDAQTGKLTVTKCGTFTVKVSTAATDTHAAGAETTATLTVNKVAPTVTAPTAKTLTYNGQKQELVNAGSTNDGTLYYVVTTENTAPADNLYTTSIPTATDAGTYYVWYKVVGDTNHNDTTSSKVEVNIKQADVKVTAPTAINSTYNGKEQALVNAGVTEDGKVFYRLGTDGTWTNTVPTAKNVGEYEVYYYVDGDDNHSDSGSAEEPLGSVKVTIAKKTVTVSGITAEGKEYDGNTGATISTENATLAGLVDGDTLTVAAKGTFSDANAGNGKKVNITDITLGGTSVDNYVLAEEGQQKEATANITPKAVTVIPDAGQSKVYGAADPAFKYTAEGIVGEEKLSGALERTAGDSVGEYAYTIGTLDSANANYNVSIAENAPKFEIKKTDQSKPEGLEIENVSAENATDGSITGVTDNMEYSTDDGKTWNAVPANADKIEGLAVGEVLVRYAGSDDKNASAEVMLTIGVASKTEGVVEFKPEEGGTTVAEKAITGVDNESTKASVEDFAETQQEEGKDVKVALEITPQKEENVNKESVEETNKVVEEVFVGIDREKVVTEYLAIDVAKYVDNGKETENISDTKTPLEIALRFDGKKTNPIVVRTHDGKAKAFGKLKARPAKKDYKDAMFYIDVENAILYIYSQYFSDFAIVYANEVTYNVGFVSGTSENLSPLVVAEGGKVTLPTGLKNEGYAFDGWYKDEAYTTAWKENDTVNEDITLYAKWNKSVTGVSVATPEERFTKAGETSDIKVTVTPEDAANTRVTYKSSDTKVATVDANGKITAVANGTATITITTEDGAKTATVKVTVAIPDVKQQGTTEQSKTTEHQVQQPTKEEKAVISMNAGLKVSQTGSKINIKWGKVKEADGYDVYVAYCGKKFGKAVKTINKNSTTSITVKKINSKKINFKKNFKVYVAAYKMVDGKKEVLAKSIMGHVVGCKNTKYSNAKKITIAKSNYSISVGKTAKIKAKTVLVQKGKKQLTDAHAKEFRYASSNKNIATVDQNGKIKGVAKGICTIYVYARNGYAKTVKITVK